jgi:hypothetical protein
MIQNINVSRRNAMRIKKVGIGMEKFSMRRRRRSKVGHSFWMRLKKISLLRRS